MNMAIRAEIERLVVEFGQDPGDRRGRRCVAHREGTAVSASYDVDWPSFSSRWIPNKSPKDLLRQTIETAEALRADPLGDLAHELAKEISEREAELKTARRAGPR